MKTFENQRNSDRRELVAPMLRAKMGEHGVNHSATGAAKAPKVTPSLQAGDIVMVWNDQWGKGLNRNINGQRFKVISVYGDMVEIEPGHYVNKMFLRKKVNGRYTENY